MSNLERRYPTCFQGHKLEARRRRYLQMESCFREAYSLKPTMIPSAKGHYEDRIAVAKHSQSSVWRGVTEIDLPLLGTRRAFLQQMNDRSGHKREVSRAKSASIDGISRTYRDISLSRDTVSRATTQPGRQGSRKDKLLVSRKRSASRSNNITNSPNRYVKYMISSRKAKDARRSPSNKLPLEHRNPRK